MRIPLGEFVQTLCASKDATSIGHINDGLFEAVAGFEYYPLYEQLKMQYTTTRSIDTEAIRQFFENTQGENPVDILLMQGSMVLAGLSADALKAEAMSMLTTLHDTLKQARLQVLESALKQAEATKDTDRMKDILEKVQALYTI